MILEIVIGIVVLIILAIIVAVYNGLITKRNRVQTAWAQIDVQLKRRYDLIPNLIATVKGYMKYEKGVLTQITQLRSSIVSGSVQDKAAANNQLSNAFKSLFAVVENYPDLKASETFKDLQDQISNTEDKIAFVRTSYNDYVLDYNNAIQEFPGNLFAGPMGFKQQDYFQTPEEEKQPVKVSFEDIDDSGSQQKIAPQKDQKKPKA